MSHQKHIVKQMNVCRGYNDNKGKRNEKSVLSITRVYSTYTRSSY